MFPTRDASSPVRPSEGKSPWPMLSISADSLSLTNEVDILGSAGKFRLSPIGVEGAVDLVKLDLSHSELVRVEAPPSRFWKRE